MLLNNEWVKNEIREEIKKFLEQMKMNSQQSKTYGHSKNSSEKKVLSDAGLPKKETFQINDLTLRL